MRTAIYVRVSTEEQANEGYSIDAQKRRLTQYCESQDWSIAGIYIDDGYSAKDTNRPELAHMLDDAKSGLLDLILVYKLDRFTRSVKDMYDLVESLQRYGVGFQSMQERFDTTTSMGRAVMGVLSVFAQLEREMIAERVRMAAEQMVIEGKRPGGIIPFGYDKNEQIIPEEAELIKRIRSLYMDGLGYKSIAMKFNQEGKLRRGSEWTQATVAYTLENPYYAGIIRMGTKTQSGGYVNINRDEKVKCVFGEGSHHPIFSKEEYDEHKKFMKRKSQNGYSKQKTYWFSGVLRCGRCGSSMFGRLTTVKRRSDGSYVRTPYYICSNKHAGRSCDMPTFRQVHVEKLFLDYLREKLESDFKPLKLFIDEVAATSESVNTTEDEIKSIRSELSKIRERRNKWQYMFVEGMIDAATVRERIEDENRREAELKELLEIKQQTSTTTIPKSDVILSIFELWEFADDEERKELVYSTISKMTINTPLTNVKGVKNKFFEATCEEILFL